MSPTPGKQSRPYSPSSTLDIAPGRWEDDSSIAAVLSSSSTGNDVPAEAQVREPTQAPFTLSSLVKRLARERSVTAMEAPVRRMRLSDSRATPRQEMDSGLRLPTEEGTLPPPYTRN